MNSRRPTLETLTARLPFAMDVVEVEPNNSAAQATDSNGLGTLPRS